MAINDAKPRISPDFPDLSGFKPKARLTDVDPKEIEQASAAAGFTRRVSNAPADEKPAPSAGFDARSLRKSNRTAKLNIATSENTRLRFWTIAQKMDLTTGEDVLTVLMDAYEREQGRGL